MANDNPTSDPHAWVGWAGCTAEVSKTRLVVGDLRPVLSHSTGAPVFGCISFKRWQRCPGEQVAPGATHPWRHGQGRDEKTRDKAGN